MIDDQILTRKDVGALLGWQPETISVYLIRCPEKVPPPHRLGQRRLVWLKSEVLAFIKSLPQTTTADVKAMHRKQKG